MTRYIIVKYAEHNFPDGKAPLSMGIYGTYSAKEVGVTQESYADKKEAEKDLKKLSNFNLGVSYGIVEVI